MAKIKRYNVLDNTLHWSPKTLVVLASDHDAAIAALEAELAPYPSQADYDALQARCERLRGALEQIVKLCGWMDANADRTPPCTKIARAALAAEPQQGEEKENESLSLR